MANNHEIQNPTILVVDDTEDNLDLLEFALRRKPVKMLRATSGYECIEIARAQNPDVILLDIQMPGMDGFETLKHLRSDELTSKIPVVLLTAQKKDPKSIEEGLQLGADLYLTKPIDTEELLVRTRMLVRVRKAEAELERIRADFMAMLVHDMRNPILIVKSFLELLLEDEGIKNLSEDLQSVADSALSASSKMLDLINEILDLSKYESGNVPLERTQVKLSTVMNEVIKQMVLQCRQKKIKIIKQIPENLPDVYIDHSKMEQALMNVLSNALKFSQVNGTILIKADTLNSQESIVVANKSYVRLVISDNGVGIPATELPDIFDRYKQLSTASSLKQKGTGLGLAICKLIVDAHGGKISVESEVNIGTAVSILLPIG